MLIRGAAADPGEDRPQWRLGPDGQPRLDMRGGDAASRGWVDPAEGEQDDD